MKKNVQKVLSGAVAFSLLATQPCFAASAAIEKSETVYVMKEADTIQEQIVSVWLHGEHNIIGKDKTNLQEMKDVKADKAIEATDGVIHWQEEKNDVYYQGKSNKSLPVDVHIDYTLNGQKISNQELKGKSGRVKITLRAENKTFTTKIIKGKEQKIYAPYVAVAMLTFDEAVAHNLNAPDSKIVKDGKNQILTTVLTPGIRDTFRSVFDDDQLETFRDQAVVEMDVQNYQPIEAYVVISNELFQGDASLNRLDDLTEGLKKLEDSSAQLVEASGKLADAQEKLTKGTTTMGEGVQKLHAGAQELDEKTGLLEEKLSPALEQVAALPGYAQQMAQGGTQLSAGIQQYTSGVSAMKEKMPTFMQGAEAVQKGASQLDEGLGQIKAATGKWNQGESPLDTLKMLRDGVMAQMNDLQQGLQQLSGGANALKEKLGTASQSASMLAEKEEALNTPLQAMNATVQNLPLEALSQLGDTDIEEALTSMGDNVAAVGKASQALTPSVESLETLANDLENAGRTEDAERLRSIATQLAEMAKDLGSGTSNLVQSADTVRTTLDALADLSGRLPNAEDSQAFKEGMKQCAEASNGITAASRQLADGLDALETGAGELADGATKISASVAQGSQKLEKEMDPSQLENLVQSLKRLDEALGQLQMGAHRLAEGSAQNVEGVHRLTNAINQLDAHSAALNEGAEKLAEALFAVEEKAQGLSAFSSLQEQGISPLRVGIRRLTDGLGELEQGGATLQAGSVVFRDNLQTFAAKMDEFKEKGIDEIDKRAGSLPEVKTILDTMSDLAKKDASFTGVGEGFQAKYRIVEKIK